MRAIASVGRPPSHFINAQPFDDCRRKALGGILHRPPLPIKLHILTSGHAGGRPSYRCITPTSRLQGDLRPKRGDGATGASCAATLCLGALLFMAALRGPRPAAGTTHVAASSKPPPPLRGPTCGRSPCDCNDSPPIRPRSRSVSARRFPPTASPRHNAPRRSRWCSTARIAPLAASRSESPPSLPSPAHRRATAPHSLKSPPRAAPRPQPAIAPKAPGL